MLLILDVPGIVVGCDVTRQKAACIGSLSLKDAVAGAGIGGVIEDHVPQNDMSAIGVIRGGLVEFVRMTSKRWLRSPLRTSASTRRV